MPWFYDREGKLPIRACKYCKTEFKPNTDKNVMCVQCQFSDARRKKYMKMNQKV